NISENAKRVWHISQGEIDVDCLRAELALHIGMQKKRLELRSKNQCTLTRYSVVDRFLTGPIPGDKELTTACVPNSKTKHPAQVVQASSAKLLVSVNYGFRIRTRLELVTK